MNNKPSFFKDISISALAGVLLGAILSGFSNSPFLTGWLGCGVLAFLLILTASQIWRQFGSEKSLAAIMLVTFIFRLALGIFLYKTLPVAGFDNPASMAGYVFSDASERDQAAYLIASQGGLFAHDLAEYKAADQYGGLLAASALIYQVFSPHHHHPLLMVLVSAFAMTAGVTFLFAAVSKKWGAKIALISGWFYALYPDGVLLGSSQMREPILIGLTCLLFWLTLDWKEKPLRTTLLGLVIVAFTCLFSLPVAAAETAVVAGIIFVEWLSSQSNRKTRTAGIVIFVLFISLAAVAGWLWLKGGLSYEFYVTQSSSGWIETLVRQYGEKLAVPFISFYGLTQPLLPAALVDTTLPIWKFIAIFRASGWYFALPFLAYGIPALMGTRKEKRNNILIFMGLAFAAWMLISSVRSGGDQWDNPRYRTTFLPWMAILFAWVWSRLHTQKCAWFWRVLAIECVFVLVFLNWYLDRYFSVGLKIGFVPMLAIIAGASGLIVVGGLIWDKLRRKPAQNAG